MVRAKNTMTEKERTEGGFGDMRMMFAPKAQRKKAGRKKKQPHAGGRPSSSKSPSRCGTLTPS